MISRGLLEWWGSFEKDIEKELAHSLFLSLGHLFHGQALSFQRWNIRDAFPREH